MCFINRLPVLIYCDEHRRPRRGAPAADQGLTEKSFPLHASEKHAGGSHAYRNFSSFGSEFVEFISVSIKKTGIFFNRIFENFAGDIVRVAYSMVYVNEAPSHPKRDRQPKL